MKKTNVDTAKLAAVKKRKKATAVIAPKKGAKKPVPKAAAVASAKSGMYQCLQCRFGSTLSTITHSAEFKEKEAASNVIKSSSNHNAAGEDGNSSSDEDYSDDEEEGEDGYRVGGYHPVCIGDKFNFRYIVIEKLGWGHFSTVWRCYDMKASTPEKPEYVALKIQKSATHYREAAIDEIQLLNCARAGTLTKAALAEYPANFDPCVVFLSDHFEHLGRNGNHVCMTFEILGENLLKVIKKYNYRGMPLSIVRDYVRQICVGMDFLHRHCKIIHTDLKPENILIAARGSDPDINFVKSIIAEKANGSGSSKKKKKAAKSDNTEGTSSKAAAAPAVVELGPDGEPLTAEMKKKLKKKLKKKRQLERKIEDKKKGGGARNGRRKARSTREGGEKRALESSVEKVTAEMEMLMMERASIPLAEVVVEDLEQQQVHEGDEEEETAVPTPIVMPNTSPKASTAADGKPAPVRAAFAQSKSGSKTSGDGDDDEKDYLAAKHASEGAFEQRKYGYRGEGEGSDREDEEDAESREYDADCKAGPSGHAHNANSGLHGAVSGGGAPFKKTNSGISLPNRNSALFVEHERVFNSLPGWLRPTVLSYLNFDLLQGVDTLGCTDKPRTRSSHQAPAPSAAEREDNLFYGRAVQILQEDFEPPSKLMQARITMVRAFI